MAFLPWVLPRADARGGPKTLSGCVEVRPLAREVGRRLVGDAVEHVDGLFQVPGCCAHAGWVVEEAPEAAIAGIADHASDAAGLVAVVDVQSAAGAVHSPADAAGRDVVELSGLLLGDAETD